MISLSPSTFSSFSCLAICFNANLSSVSNKPWSLTVSPSLRKILFSSRDFCKTKSTSKVLPTPLGPRSKTELEPPPLTVFVIKSVRVTEGNWNNKYSKKYNISISNEKISLRWNCAIQCCLTATPSVVRNRNQSVWGHEDWSSPYFQDSDAQFRVSNNRWRCCRNKIFWNAT